MLHWFTGTKAEAVRALELGCYFSINAAMLDNQRHAAMVAAIPIDRLLTETDGPFTKTGSRPSKPADVAVAVEALGRLHGVPSATVATTVRNNLRSLLENGEQMPPKGREPDSFAQQPFFTDALTKRRG